MSRLLPCPPLPCCFCPRVSAGIFLCFVTVSCVFLCGSAFAVLPPFVSFLGKRLWRLLATLSGLVFPCRWPAETQSLMVARYLVVDLWRLLRALAASTTRIRVWLAVQFFLRASSFCGQCARACTSSCSSLCCACFVHAIARALQASFDSFSLLIVIAIVSGCNSSFCRHFQLEETIGCCGTGDGAVPHCSFSLGWSTLR